MKAHDRDLPHYAARTITCIRITSPTTNTVSRPKAKTHKRNSLCCLLADWVGDSGFGRIQCPLLLILFLLLFLLTLSLQDTLDS